MTALRDALRLLLRSDDVQVFDYAWRDDFEELWEALQSGCAALPAHVVIAWADTAHDPDVAPVYTTPHVTPIDWAACAVTDRGDLCVTVVDLDPSHHRHFPAYRLHQRLNLAHVQWVRVLCATDLAVATETELRALLHASPGHDCRDDASDFLVLRRADFVASGSPVDRHAISNLIAPLLLLRHENESMAGHARSLFELLRRASMLPAGSSAGRSPSMPGPVRFVLLDDQWQHGWAEWVCRQLDLAYDPTQAYAAVRSGDVAPQLVTTDQATGISVWVSSGPEWLHDKLESLIAQGAGQLALRLVDEGDARPEVLLLDLRLFSGRATDEEAWQRKWAVLEARIRQRSRWWPPDSRVDNGQADTVQTASGADHMTLLPRLIANVDPSLPIVIFSSTTRRAVAEALRGYTGIVTSFAKPHLFSDTASMASAEDALATALQGAAKAAANRQRVLRVSAAASPTRSSGVNAGLRHAALYVDESGGRVARDDLTMAGILGLFSSVEAEWQFNLELAGHGVHWGPGGHAKRPPASERARVFDDVLALAQRHGVTLMGVALTSWNQQRPRTAMGRHAAVADYLDLLHRQLFGALCRCCMFHLAATEGTSTWTVLSDMRAKPIRGSNAREVLDTLRAFGLQPRALSAEERMAEAGRNLAKRVRAMPATDARDIVCRLVAGLGVAPPPEPIADVARLLEELITGVVLGGVSQPAPTGVLEGMKVPLMGAESVYPLVMGLFEQHAAHSRARNKRVVEAQACPLPEGTPAAQRKPNRSLHFLADWFANEVYSCRGGRPPDGGSRALADAGFVARYEQPVLALLSVADWLREGHHQRALVALAGMGDWLASTPESNLRDECLAVIAAELQRVPGPELARALYSADSHERGRIVFWGTDAGGNEYGLVESHTFGDVAYLKRECVRPPTWKPRRGDDVSFRRRQSEGRPTVVELTAR